MIWLKRWVPADTIFISPPAASLAATIISWMYIHCPGCPGKLAVDQSSSRKKHKQHTSVDQELITEVHCMEHQHQLMSLCRHELWLNDLSGMILFSFCSYQWCLSLPQAKESGFGDRRRQMRQDAETDEDERSDMTAVSCSNNVIDNLAQRHLHQMTLTVSLMQIVPTLPPITSMLMISSCTASLKLLCQPVWPLFSSVLQHLMPGSVTMHCCSIRINLKSSTSVLDNVCTLLAAS